VVLSETERIMSDLMALITKKERLKNAN
jgi:hypothetical protein